MQTLPHTTGCTCKLACPQTKFSGWHSLDCSAAVAASALSMQTGCLPHMPARLPGKACCASLAPAACPALPAGLLHRAVYVWVFREQDGALLVQRRSAAKKIGAGQWDLSVAEHLQPGEGYLRVRGRVGRQQTGGQAGRELLVKGHACAAQRPSLPCLCHANS